MSDIETFNKVLVAYHHDGLRIMNPPREPLTRDDCYLLAAYLVTTASVLPKGNAENFEEVLRAVESV